MTFKIIWDKGASDELDKLEAVVARRIAKKVRELEDDPYSLDVKRLKGSEAFRLRVGDYRIIFSIEKDTLFILKVGHRKNIYRR